MTIKKIRESTHLSQAKFCEMYGIPRRTLEAWETGQNEAAPYLVTLLERAVKADSKFQVIGHFINGGEYVETFTNEEDLARITKKIFKNEACRPPDYVVGRIHEKFLPRYLKNWLGDYPWTEYKMINE